MNKIFKSVLSSVLALTAAFSMACTMGGTTGDGTSGGTASGEITRHTYDGTHIMTAPEVKENEWLVKDGKSDYALIVPATANQDGHTKNAIAEFTYFFEKATDISLSPVTDDSESAELIVTNDSARRISIGFTSIFNAYSDAEKKSILGYDARELGPDGVRIVKVNNTVFILGGTTEGVLYAVYDFMEICFNYKFYYRNCIQIDTGVRNLKMRNFDVTDIPDTVIRPSGNNITLFTDRWEFESDSGLVTDQDVKQAKNRYRYVNVNDSFLPIFKNYNYPQEDVRTYGFHSVDYFLPSDYVSQDGTVKFRTNWRATDGGGSDQLCFTAHGNKDDLDLMVDACVEKIIYSLTVNNGQYKDRRYVGFTVMDGDKLCGCSSCKAQAAKDGGSLAGQVVRVSNRIMKKVQAWRAQNGMNDDFYLYFFAYGSTSAAPVVLNETTGKYQPANDEVICRDDVISLLCISGSTRSMYWAEEYLDGALKNVDNWMLCTKNLFNWMYQMDYLYYPEYVDAISQLNGDLYAYLLNAGSQYIYNQGEWESENNTSYGILNEYLFAKMMWNTSLNMEDLIKDFFKAMYKDAADTMYEIFNRQREHSIYISAKTNTFGFGTNRANAANYPYNGFLKPIIDLFEQALDEIEELKVTSPAEYELVRKRIETEYVGPLYMALDLHSITMPYDAATRVVYKERLMNICSTMYFKIAENVPGNMYDAVVAM